MRSALAALATLLVASMSSAGDGVLEINQTCAVQTGCFEGDAPGFPVTISAAGSYQLTSNVEAGSESHGVSIDADYASLDLRGFLIRGQNLPLYAPITGSGSHLVVRNGSVANWSHGIELAGSKIRLENLDIAATDYGRAIIVGSQCSIIGNIASGRGGIVTGGGCLIERNLILQSGQAPCIEAGSGSIISGNRGNCIDQGVVAQNSLISENVFSTTWATAINAQGGVVDRNVIRAVSGAYGIAASGAVISNNRVTGGSLSAQIKCSDCIVHHNFAEGGPGVALDATGGTGSTGFESNQFNNTNGGNLNPQTIGGIETGPNICGGDLTCP